MALVRVHSNTVRHSNECLLRGLNVLSNPVGLVQQRGKHKTMSSALCSDNGCSKIHIGTFLVLPLLITMAVLIETSLGDLEIDLYVDDCPMGS